MKRLLTLAVMLLGLRAGAATIGGESLVSMPSGAVSNRWITLRPGDGETVTINPPIFSWLFTPTPSMRASDTTIWIYQFQVSYSATFATTVVDVRTKCNFYNFLPPFNSGTVYWRVGYIDTDGSTNAWSAHSFIVPVGATTWDRSMLSSNAYLLGKGHPRMLFSSNTLPVLQSNILSACLLQSASQSTNDLYKTYEHLTNVCSKTLSQTWTFGTGDLSVDFWVRFNGVPGAGMALMSATNGTADGWTIYLDSASKLAMRFVRGGSTNGSYIMSSAWSPSSATWYHLAFIRSGSSGFIFIDGTAQTLTTTVAFGANNAGDVYGALLVGRSPDVPDLNGWMDELRIGKGIARWTSNFTPETAEYGGSEYNVVLENFNGTEGQTNLLDSTSYAPTVVCAGGAHVTTAQQKFGTGSMAFDGTGDYVLLRNYWLAPYSITNLVNSAWLPVTYQMPMLRDFALTYRITGNTNFLIGTNLCYAAGQLAEDGVNAGYINDTWDNISGGLAEWLGMAYDWCYDSMTAWERSNIVHAVELSCPFSMYLDNDTTSSQGWWADLSTKTGSRWTLQITNLHGDAYIAGKNGLGHPWGNMNYALEAALAVYSESTDTNVWDVLQIGMNYMLAKDYPFCANNGEGINTGAEYAYNAMQRDTPKTMMFHSAFPEAGFNRNPIYTNLVAWFDWMLPVGFQQASWPWGDIGWGRTTEWVLPGALAKALCALTGSGTAWEHWRNQFLIYANYPTPDAFTTIMESANSLTNYLTAANVTTNARWFPEGGWVMGATHAPNSLDCFTNGVGFIFQARPGGCDFEHDHVSDLSFQLWAYGSVITDAGDGYDMLPYGKVPMAHYSLMVNGIGQGQALIQSNSVYNRIFAYAATSNYVYAAADGTASYPTNVFNIAGGWLYPQLYFNAENGGPLVGLTKVIRHVLFMRDRGYFVVYDDLADNNAVTYSWLYHVLENTVTNPSTAVFPNTLTFSYSSDTLKVTGLAGDRAGNTNWPPVSVYVSHIANAAGLSWTNMTGTHVRQNPITGDDYYALGSSGQGVRTNCLWISNASPTTNFHFLTVIYPVKPGDSAPSITRLDDYTVAVTNAGAGDVIGFNTNSSFAGQVTLMVNVSASDVIPPTPTPPATNTATIGTINAGTVIFR